MNYKHVYYHHKHPQHITFNLISVRTVFPSLIVLSKATLKTRKWFYKKISV